MLVMLVNQKKKSSENTNLLTFHRNLLEMIKLAKKLAALTLLKVGHVLLVSCISIGRTV